MVLSSLFLALTAGSVCSSRTVHRHLAWGCTGRKLGIGGIISWDVFVELLASLVNVVHLVVSGTTGATDTDQVLLIDLVSDLGQLALLAADVLHDEFVEMALQVGQGVLALNDGFAFGIGAHFNTKVFQDGAFGDSQGASHLG